MKRKLCLIIFSSFLLICQNDLPGKDYQSSSEEKEHPIDKKMNECLKGNDNIECFKTALVDWDKELNKNYKGIVTLIKNDAALLNALKTSQLSWLQHRDKEFLFIDAQFKGLEGTMYPPLKMKQKVEIVRSRALELQTYFLYYYSNN